MSGFLCDPNAKRGRTWLEVLIGLALGFLGMYWLLPFVFFDIIGGELALKSDANAKPAGRDLAVLCQTCRLHPEWFEGEPPWTPAWIPASVLELRATSVHVNSNGASVEFGGGFHHYGYSLHLVSDEIASDGLSTWQMSFYSEDRETQLLGTITVAQDHVLAHEEFVDRAFQEFDRRIGTGHSGSGDCSSSAQRFQFAVKHREIERLKDAIRKSASECAGAWREALLVYVMDWRTDPISAADQLRRWATAHGDYSGWLMAAYGFWETGAYDDAERAVLQACSFPASDAEWIDLNARYYGYVMCRRLCSIGRHDTSATLCNVLLAYQGSGDYLEAEITAVHQVCDNAATSGTSVSLPTVDDDWVFKPFAGIDIEILRTGETGAGHNRE